MISPQLTEKFQVLREQYPDFCEVMRASGSTDRQNKWPRWVGASGRRGYLEKVGLDTDNATMSLLYEWLNSETEEDIAVLDEISPGEVSVLEDTDTQKVVAASGFTPEGLMAHLGLLPDEWEYTKVQGKSWNAFMKDNSGQPTIAELHSLNATFTKKIDAEFTPCPGIELIQEYSPKDPEGGVVKTLFIPDAQIGYIWTGRMDYLEPMHDRAAMSAVWKLASDLQPDRIIILGDMLDIAGAGTYELEPSYRQTLRPSIHEWGWWLMMLREACPYSEIDYFEGNHEKRLLRAMWGNQRSEELWNLERAGEDKPMFRLRELLHLDKLGVEYIAPYGETKAYHDHKLYVGHGDKVKAGGGKTSSALVQSTSASFHQGHIHKVEIAHRIHHDQPGTPMHSVASSGCLCRTDGAVPGYSRKQDYQRGCGVAYYDEESGALHQQVIPIHGHEPAHLYYGGRKYAGFESDVLDPLVSWTGWKQFKRG